MTKHQKQRSSWALGVFSSALVVIGGAFPIKVLAAENSQDVRKLEEQIFDAEASELSALEIKIAKLLQNEPRSATANYLMSVLLLKMFTLEPGSYSLIRQSTELAAQSYELDPKSDLAISSMASILEITGESTRGLDLIRDAGIKGVQLGWRSKLASARLLFDGKNGADVLKALEEVVKYPDYSPSIVAPTLITAITSTYQGQDQIPQLLEWRKRSPSLNIDLAIANAFALGLQYDEALDEYSKIIEKQPSNAEALLSKGIISLTQKKDNSTAIKLFQRAIQHSKLESDKLAAETHLALALISQKKGSATPAISASVQAINDAGDQEAVLMTVLTSFRKNQGLNATLDFLGVLSEKVPGLHLAHALKAELLSEKMGRHFEATRDFTNAITLEPGRSEYYNGRGLAWMGLSNLEAALADFQTAVATNPGDASARYNVACAQARLGMNTAAIDSLSKAIELDERLMSNARTDKDLVSLHSEPDFNTLVTDGPKVFSVAH